LAQAGVALSGEAPPEQDPEASRLVAMAIKPLGMLKGESQDSKLLDGFVLVHAVCATSFASAALFKPSVFGFLVEAEAYPPLAMDATRWASPFIFGFGILAALSLTMRAEERYKVACMYTGCLGMEVPIGLFVQLSGRWNLLLLTNTVLFAGIAAGYAYFIFKAPLAFNRTGARFSTEFSAQGVFKGSTSASQLFDAFVAAHACCALAFASVMLFKPSLFTLFTLDGAFPPLAEDAIRWACPFVYGFGTLAGISLTMRGEERLKVASMFAACLGLAVPIGLYVQSTGRWNTLHLLNIMLFGSLSGGYWFFLSKSSEAFTRASCSGDSRQPLKS